MTETAEKCRTSRRPSRPAVEAWRRYSQAQGMWPWSKGNLDMRNSVRRVDGEIVAPTFPPQTGMGGEQ